MPNFITRLKPYKPKLGISKGKKDSSKNTPGSDETKNSSKGSRTFIHFLRKIHIYPKFSLRINKFPKKIVPENGWGKGDKLIMIISHLTVNAVTTKVNRKL